MDLCAWKFRIRSNEERALPSDPAFTFSGCMAIAVAPTADEARRVLRVAMREAGADSRWLEPGCADVVCIDLEGPASLGWAMV